MYQSLPEFFLIPVRYSEKDIFEKKVLSQKWYCNSTFINKTTNRKDIVIGVSLPTEREDIWQKVKKSMEEYTKEKGITLKVEFNDFNAVKQSSQIENLIVQGIDVLILVPLNRLGEEELVEKAHKAGVKVISYEGPVKNSNLDLNIAFNNFRVGQLQGRFLTEKVPRGNYIIISGDIGIEFKEGAMEYIQPLANIRNIRIVTDKVIKDWNPKLAFEIVKDSLIINNNNIDAAIKLVNGKAVDVNSYVNNGKIEVPSILIEPIAIDKNNIDSVLINSGYYTKEEVYKRL
jgi:D-xylose transport system substrate-binding protein